jgi:hypothetical protein
MATTSIKRSARAARSPFDFTADIPGEFEVEAHKLSPSLLFTLVVK